MGSQLFLQTGWETRQTGRLARLTSVGSQSRGLFLGLKQLTHLVGLTRRDVVSYFPGTTCSWIWTHRSCTKFSLLQLTSEQVKLI